MNCPECNGTKNKVLFSRNYGHNDIPRTVLEGMNRYDRWRRRECTACKNQWDTVEKPFPPPDPFLNYRL